MSGTRITWRQLGGYALLLATTGCYVGANSKSTAADDAFATDTDTVGAETSAGGSGGPQDSSDTMVDPDEVCGGVGAGQAPMRRLTKPQYDNTIRDLFAGAIEPGTEFPLSLIHEGYTNNPAANVVSLAAAEDIMLAAESVAEQVVDRVDEIVGCEPGLACAETFIDDFGPRALRRPLEPQEREALVTIFSETQGEVGFADAIGVVVMVLLQSPKFLYLLESGEDLGGGVVALDDYALAARLSYLLWDSPPDAELRDLAAAGDLETPETLRLQAQRLLDDRGRSGPAIDRFVREWLHYDGLASYEKDLDLYPEFDEALVSSMDLELSRFIDGVLASDTPTVGHLLTSSTTEVDATLAGFYGIAAPAAGTWQQVQLPAEQRSGLLTRPALLAEHSFMGSSGPIFRGRLVRTQLLCDEIPPAPPDAMANVPEYPEGATERERTEILMNHLSCGACHGLMNGIGLGFENYDAIGAWRDVDVDGSPINASGDVQASASGLALSFDGVRELGSALAQNDAVSSCFARQFYGHSLGLEPVQIEDCAVLPAEEAFVESGGDIPTLILTLVQSNAFRLRTLSEGEE